MNLSGQDLPITGFRGFQGGLEFFNLPRIAIGKILKPTLRDLENRGEG